MKNIEVLYRIDQLIRLKCTGNSREFAHKLNISRSTLMRNIALLRDFGAPIKYCSIRNTYTYTEHVRFFLGFIPQEKLKELRCFDIRGGQDSYIKELNFFLRESHLMKLYY